MISDLLRVNIFKEAAMFSRVGNRILGRLLGLAIIAIIVTIIIPLFNIIIDFVRNFPSWILILSCCAGGGLLIGGLFTIGKLFNSDQEKHYEIIKIIEKGNSAALKMFDSKLKKAPTTTKKNI